MSYYNQAPPNYGAQYPAPGYGYPPQPGYPPPPPAGYPTGAPPAQYPQQPPPPQKSGPDFLHKYNIHVWFP
ncbi:hypothetical protein EJ110_NYTH12470 [Nymphaea thermarum]|nr:hypothetical protein EJ110_NYTH12470 [Nymphaea thermarum]